MGFAPVDQLPVEIWKEVIDTNLTGTFLVTRAALPLMRPGGQLSTSLGCCVAAVCRHVRLQRIEVWRSWVYPLAS